MSDHKHLRARFESKDPKRILALDGGGSRGVMTLGFLVELEEELGQRTGSPGFRLSDYFDMISGTSTGSIIAAGLALGMRVDDIVDLYFKLCPELFKWRPTGISDYDNKPLRKALFGAFEKKTLGSVQLKTGLSIHMKRIDSGSPWIVVNHPDWVYAQDRRGEDGNIVTHGNLGYRLDHLCLASSAAPTYFQNVKLKIGHDEDGGEKLGHFIDGGASPNNNPAMQTLLTVSDPAFGFNWRMGEDALSMLSVGTVYVRLRYDLDNPARELGAKDIRAYQDLNVLDRLKAVISGYNHDISLQQVMTLQAMSRARLPWHINSESKMQAHSPFLSTGPVLDFQRLDVRIECAPKGRRRPEHIEELLGEAIQFKTMERLRKLNISDPGLLDLLFNAGKALARTKLEHRSSTRETPVFAPVLGPEYPRSAFNSPEWGATAR